MVPPSVPPPEIINEKDALRYYVKHTESLQILNARIITPPGYEPKEVWADWETNHHLEAKSYFRTRGYVSNSQMWIGFQQEEQDRLKYLLHVYSRNCELAAYVSESIEIGHIRDVIQLFSVKLNKALRSIVLPPDEMHGPINVTGINAHFKFSPCNRKLLYFARPTAKQLKTKNEKERKFVICVYEFDTNGLAVFTDENLCAETINKIEWAPDSRGFIFHRESQLCWYTFNENGVETINLLFKNIPSPFMISLSPNGSRFAVFTPRSDVTDSLVFLFHWPIRNSEPGKEKPLHRCFSLQNWSVWKVPERPWAHDGTSLIFNMNYQSRTDIFIMSDYGMKTIPVNTDNPSIVVDVLGDEMLIESRAADRHSRLWIITVPTAPILEKPVAYLTEDCNVEEAGEHPSLRNFDVAQYMFDKNAYTGIIYTPRAASKTSRRPLIVVPHSGNGPNFTVTCRDPVLSSFANCGFFVLILNYREPFTVTMPETEFTKCFETEIVDDIHKAVQGVLNSEKRIDAKHVILYGKEFGSFVAASCLIKHPEFYRKSVFVRPILEFPHEHGETSTFPKESEPIRNADKIRTPIMMIIDPMSEEYEFQEFEDTLVKNGVDFAKKTDDEYTVDTFIPDVVRFMKPKIV